MMFRAYPHFLSRADLVSHVHRRGRVVAYPNRCEARSHFILGHEQFYIPRDFLLDLIRDRRAVKEFDARMYFDSLVFCCLHEYALMKPGFYDNSVPC